PASQASAAVRACRMPVVARWRSGSRAAPAVLGPPAGAAGLAGPRLLGPGVGAEVEAGVELDLRAAFLCHVCSLRSVGRVPHSTRNRWLRLWSIWPGTGLPLPAGAKLGAGRHLSLVRHPACSAVAVGCWPLVSSWATLGCGVAGGVVGGNIGGQTGFPGNWL